jgi:hypothetical protein
MLHNQLRVYAFRKVGKAAGANTSSICAEIDLPIANPSVLAFKCSLCYITLARGKIAKPKAGTSPPLSNNSVVEILERTGIAVSGLKLTEFGEV